MKRPSPATSIPRRFPIRTSSSAPAASFGSATSCSGNPPMRSSCSCRCCGPISRPRPCRPRSANTARGPAATAGGSRLDRRNHEEPAPAANSRCAWSRPASSAPSRCSARGRASGSPRSRSPQQRSSRISSGSISPATSARRRSSSRPAFVASILVTAAGYHAIGFGLAVALHRRRVRHQRRGRGGRPASPTSRALALGAPAPAAFAGRWLCGADLSCLRSSGAPTPAPFRRPADRRAEALAGRLARQDLVRRDRRAGHRRRRRASPFWRSPGSVSGRMSVVLAHRALGCFAGRRPVRILGEAPLRREGFRHARPRPRRPARPGRQPDLRGRRSRRSIGWLHGGGGAIADGLLAW